VNVRKALIPAALVAALLAPNAMAIRDRAATSTPGATAAVAQQSSSIRPDDRAGSRGIGSLQEAGRPDDRAGLHGPGSFSPTVVQSTSTGFDWGDAFVGSVGGLGAALALMGILFLVASRRSKARMA
jgi:hypothetical protein